MSLRQRYGRELIKASLAPLLRWSELAQPQQGYSIILGVPWDLRHLLPVNLRFIARTNHTHLHHIHVIFDRRQRRGAETLTESSRRDFPELPLSFQFYPALAGHIIERVNVSTFYNSMNTVLGLSSCTTRYAILHDFDLYPLSSNYFEHVAAAMHDRNLRFAGLEYTSFENLTETDAILGTWCLGIDVPWLRSNYRPIDCFHKVASLNGRPVNLDPYSWIQTRTPERDLVRTINSGDCCHVKNLCSTYLRFVTGRWSKIVWRLHFVWYLETLAGDSKNFDIALNAMRDADDRILVVGNHEVDFADTDPTCANVLRHELTRMEYALFGECRPHVEEYIRAFEMFLCCRNKSDAIQIDAVGTK